MRCAVVGAFVVARGRSNTENSGVVDVAAAVVVVVAIAFAATAAGAGAGAVAGAAAGTRAVATAGPGALAGAGAGAAGAVAATERVYRLALTCPVTCVALSTASVVVASQVTRIANHPMG
jgi:hypothetical protein